MPTPNEIAAENLARLRIEEGLTRRELAERSGIREDRIRALEGARRDRKSAITPDEIAALCLALDALVMDLLLPDDEVEVDGIPGDGIPALVNGWRMSLDLFGATRSHMDAAFGLADYSRFRRIVLSCHPIVQRALRPWRAEVSRAFHTHTASFMAYQVDKRGDEKTPAEAAAEYATTYGVEVVPYDRALAEWREVDGITEGIIDDHTKLVEKKIARGEIPDPEIPRDLYGAIEAPLLEDEDVDDREREELLADSVYWDVIAASVGEQWVNEIISGTTPDEEKGTDDA